MGEFELSGELFEDLLRDQDVNAHEVYAFLELLRWDDLVIVNLGFGVQLHCEERI